MHGERPRGEVVFLEEVLGGPVTRQRDRVDPHAPALGAEGDEVTDDALPTPTSRAPSSTKRSVTTPRFAPDRSRSTTTAPNPSTTLSMVPTTTRASSRASNARYESSSGSGHASRSTHRLPPRIAASSARIAAASSTMDAMSCSPAGRLSSTSAELRDLAEDRVATTMPGLVRADRLERRGVETVEPLDHL